MGLKQVRFIDWFRGEFPEAVRVVFHRERARFDSVFIDVNCILHPAVMGAKSEAACIKKLFKILDRLLAQYTPIRICYLSVDGPAPASKIVTQKSRRASKVRLTLLSVDGPIPCTTGQWLTHLAHQQSRSKASSGMSSLQITPGCPFMTRLEQYLGYYAVRYMQQRDKRDIPAALKFVIDHSNNPGEGEVLVLALCRCILSNDHSSLTLYVILVYIVQDHPKHYTAGCQYPWATLRYHQYGLGCNPPGYCSGHA